MKKKLIISISAVLSLLIIGGGTFAVYTANRPQTAPVASVQPVKTPPTVPELLKLVNAERAKVGVAPLTIDENMMTTAQWKSDDMHNRGYLSHWPATIDGQPNTKKYTVDKDMRRLLDQTCTESSENYYYEMPMATSTEAMSWWEHSAPHIAAIKNARYTKTGFGISANQIVVEHFCIAR